MTKYIYLLFFFNIFLIQSQNTFKGKILSQESKNIPYAKIIVKDTNYSTYSNASGYFELKNIQKKDSLHIFAVGYKDTLITNLSLESPIEILLQAENSEVLDDLIINTQKSKELHWINFFGNKSGKFRKKYYRNKYYHFQTLFKGSVNINQFIAVDTLRITGFSVYTVSNITQNIVLRPILLQNELDLNSNLANDGVKTFNLRKGKTGKIIPLEFSFENVITFYPGEQVNIGVELIGSDYLYSDGKIFIPIICYNKEIIPISSFRKKILKDEISENFNTQKKYHERPFYFELKIVK